MTDLISKISGLRTWKNGDTRAPHKPLLILWALGQIKNGNKGPWAYETIKKHVEILLAQFGKPSKKIIVNYPYVRLVNDGFWAIKGLDVEPNKDYSNQKLAPTKADFTVEFYEQLTSDFKIIDDVIIEIIESHFPNTYHKDILESIGVEINVNPVRNRDPNFREKVLSSYNYKCAICGFDLKIGRSPIGLEAAHIKWFQAGGPDIENNGIALCSNHHKLFDYGGFKINDEYKIEVSPKLNGTLLKTSLLDFQGERLSLPSYDNLYPKLDYLEWHVKEVFIDYT